MAVAAAEKAVRCLGRGFDMTCDTRLKYCKDAGGCLVERSGVETAPLAVPGVGTVGGVPVDVKCGKGDRVRLKSGVLEFNKVSNTVPIPCTKCLSSSDHLLHLTFYYRKIKVCLNLFCL
jgi:hypothetical protein